MVMLSDPKIPDTFQPYHVFETRKGPAAEAMVEKLKSRVADVAVESIDKLLKDSRALGFKPARAVLVVGSNVDPKTLKNEHIRWHASEGQLFRTVVEKALRSKKIACEILLLKEIYKAGAAALKMPEEQLKTQVKDLGRTQGSWRAEDKAAALAAWLGLTAQRNRRTESRAKPNATTT